MPGEVILVYVVAVIYFQPLWSPEQGPSVVAADAVSGRPGSILSTMQTHSTKLSSLFVLLVLLIVLLLQSKNSPNLLVYVLTYFLP